MGGKRYLRTAAEDSVLAYELDPNYVKAYVRAAEAHLALNERATVRGPPRDGQLHAWRGQLALGGRAGLAWGAVA